MSDGIVSRDVAVSQVGKKDCRFFDLLLVILAGLAVVFFIMD